MKKALFTATALAIMLCSSHANAGFGLKKSDGALKRATGKAVGVLSEQVTVSNKSHGATWYKWDAETPSGTYRCEATDLLQDVNCIKVAATVANNK